MKKFGARLARNTSKSEKIGSHLQLMTMLIGKKHGKSINISEQKQVSLHKAFESSNAQKLRSNDFLFDLTKMMTEVDILLNKVNHYS